MTNYGTIQQNVCTGKGKSCSCLRHEGIWESRAVTPLVLTSAHYLDVASQRFQHLRRLHNHWPWSGYYDMTLLVFYAWFLSGPVFLLLNSPYGFIVLFAVKVPQITKILKNKTAEGISFLSVVLDLFAITSNMSYNVIKGFPFR